MKPYPETKDEMRTVLRDLYAQDALWHLDDDPDEISGRVEGAWRRALVAQMNNLWQRDVPACDRHLINVAAWRGLEECVPQLFELNSCI